MWHACSGIYSVLVGSRESKIPLEKLSVRERIILRQTRGS
jgi:hypothetical protein